MLCKTITRRGFLKTAAAGTLTAGATFGYTWRIEPHWVELVHRPLPIDRLPRDLMGKRLVHITDLHIGPVVDDAFLLRCIRQINELSPDLLVITGDLMSCRDNERVEHAASILKHLQPASLGTLAVLGNHDYGRRWSGEHIAQQLSQRLDSLGINVLRNQTATINGLTIAGLDDLWSPRFAPAPTLAQLDAQRANLVLCHNPDVADMPVWGGYRGWMLCGHTHGGQCSAPLFGPPILPVKNKRYVQGEIDLHDGRMMYINRGLGYLHRVRFNARPEITVFTLASA